MLLDENVLRQVEALDLRSGNTIVFIDLLQFGGFFALDCHACLFEKAVQSGPL